MPAHRPEVVGRKQLPPDVELLADELQELPEGEGGVDHGPAGAGVEGGGHVGVGEVLAAVVVEEVLPPDRVLAEGEQVIRHGPGHGDPPGIQFVEEGQEADRPPGELESVIRTAVEPHVGVVQVGVLRGPVGEVRIVVHVDEHAGEVGHVLGREDPIAVAGVEAATAILDLGAVGA